MGRKKKKGDGDDSEAKTIIQAGVQMSVGLAQGATVTPGELPTSSTTFRAR